MKTCKVKLLVEALEDRLAPAGVQPYALINPQALSSPAGYNPAQMRQAYGFDDIRFGGIAGDGSGQTIAVVTAYDNPTIAGDLHEFSAYYGLPDAVFTKVNPDGITPAANYIWAVESALDVQWAHAMAPGADILLVQASSNSYADMLAAVQYAASQPGVSVVSMSWGSAEFVEELQYDSTFVTPAGHAAVAYVAAAGDTGGRASYPAVSPNVLAVGGTKLTLDAAGNYLGEAAWASGGGGVSAFQAQPDYQHGIVTQSEAYRTAVDVAYHADPQNGVPIYMTYGQSPAAPWRSVGGTSAGAPQWAALMSILNQGRALNGLAPLSSPQVLSALYNMPAGNFHDITTGLNGFPAVANYDLATGLGTPAADALVNSLLTAADLAAHHFKMYTPATAAPGTQFSFTLQVQDIFNNPAPYTGTVHFTSSDAGAILPADYTFTAADNGSQTFTATLALSGSQTITASDAASGLAITAHVPTLVRDVRVNYPDITAAGTTQTFTVQIVDPAGNVDAGYNGTFYFMISDPTGQYFFPKQGTITSGTGTFQGMMRTVGTQTITISDGVRALGSEAVTVIPGPLQYLQLAGIVSGATAGTPLSYVSVSALDSCLNLITDYAAGLTMTSTDLQAVLPPAPFYLTNGSIVFSNTITLKTAGTQSLAVSSPEGISQALTFPVSAAAPATFSFDGLSSEVDLGAEGTYTLTAYDAYGNVAGGYSGSANLTSSDPNAALTPTVSFVNGTATFSVAFNTSGTQTLTAASASAVATQSVTVHPGPVAGFVVSGLPAAVTAGKSFNFSVTAVDAFGTAVPSFTGTVHFASSDPQGVLPGDYTFQAADQGSKTFSATLKTAGNMSVTISSGAVLSSFQVQVNPGAAVSFVLVAPSSVIVNDKFALTVRAVDAYGNTATGYKGTVRFKSSDAYAELPSDYTFTSADQGVHTFYVRLRTTGFQTITVTDKKNPGLSAWWWFQVNKRRG